MSYTILCQEHAYLLVTAPTSEMIKSNLGMAAANMPANRKTTISRVLWSMILQHTSQHHQQGTEGKVGRDHFERISEFDSCMFHIVVER